MIPDYISIADLKKHLNVDHDEDDAYISDLYESAVSAIETYLNAPLSDYCNSSECPHEALNPAIKHAIRLLVGTWYSCRENVLMTSATTLPDGIACLLLPLKNFKQSAEEGE